MIDNVKGCLAKHRYGSEAVAEEVKNRLWFKRRVALRVYACTDCGGYHLTSAQRPSAETSARQRGLVPSVSASRASSGGSADERERMARGDALDDLRSRHSG